MNYEVVLAIRFRFRKKFSPTFKIHVFFFSAGILTWPALAEFEVFERFHTFSRTHEDWDLDELILLAVNLTLALLLSLVVQTRRLKNTMRALHKENARAERNARHDPLTGLLNRCALTSKLEQRTGEDGEGNRGVVALVDLDRFKPVNDLHGHAAGDIVLQVIARRLEQEIGEDGLVARLGGDEFALVYADGTNAEQAERISRRVLRALEQPIVYKDARLTMSGSIGLARWTIGKPGVNPFEHADKALIAAKRLGRNQFSWYDAELDRQSKDRAAIEADLKTAIEKEQITAWFQPIVEIDTRKLTGFEVLARWEHPTRGQMSPSVFVGIAEDCGLIEALGWSVLRQACRAASQWQTDLSIAFNLSPRQFHDRNLLERVRSLLAEHDFDPNRLTIEITESTVIKDFDAARAALDGLKAIGVSIALDDFGTGYSSLASLRKLPFDRIKIDRSFVTDITDNPENQKIVSGIMALASGLQLEVTAEGIETPNDLEFLEDQHCAFGQGFLFEKALPPDQVSWLLETKWSENIVEFSDQSPRVPVRQDKTA